MSFMRHVTLKGDPFSLLALIFGIGIALSPPGTISGPIFRALEKVRADKAAQDAARLAARRSPLVRSATAAAASGGSPFIDAALFCSALVLLDQFAGWDILYRAFGVDILPKSPLEKRLREERCRWRRGHPARVREAFFQLERERLDALGVRYVEEHVEATMTGTGLVDPGDVLVFYIYQEGDVAVKICVALNVDSYEPDVMERADRTTRWILTELVESKLAEGKVDMPCKIERVYRDRSDGEHLLQLSESEAGSLTLADAWDRREGEGLVMKGDMSLETWSEVTMESVVPE